MITADEARYLQSIQRTGGTITNQWWHVTTAAIFGEGNLQFHLDRLQLGGDLALVLRIDWQKDTNIAVQLLDQQGRFGQRILEIDYDTYAEGEAELGWLNSSVHVKAAKAFALDAMLLEIVTRLQAAVAAEGDNNRNR